MGQSLWLKTQISRDLSPCSPQYSGSLLSSTRLSIPHESSFSFAKMHPAHGFTYHRHLFCLKITLAAISIPFIKSLSSSA